MPSKGWKPENPDKGRTLVFDAFIALDPIAEVVLLWPEVALSPNEEWVPRLVLSQLNYFGRAESWSAARLSEEWIPRHDGTWGTLDKETSEVVAEINCAPLNGSEIPNGQELVRVLAADPTSWNQWGYGEKRARPDPPWNLLAQTADLHAERWSDPPGSRWLTYLCPFNAFVRKTFIERAPRKSGGITVVRYALDGAVLPLVQETVVLSWECSVQSTTRKSCAFPVSYGPTFVCQHYLDSTTVHRAAVARLVAQRPP